jgi:hypothetical protein
MPGGDRTGPAGMGPMTGRAAGYCAGYPGPGYVSPAPMWGSGWGGGRGRGWRHGYRATGLPRWARGFAPSWGWFPSYGPPAPPTREQEADALKAQADWLQSQLDDINQRLAELDQE